MAFCRDQPNRNAISSLDLTRQKRHGIGCIWLAERARCRITLSILIPQTAPLPGRDGQLICKTSNGERKLPLEDVACTVVTSFSASIHSHLIIEAAKHGVALVLRKAFMPVSILMPANRSTDTLLPRAVLELAPRMRQKLWQKTVDAKCHNQFALAAHIPPADTQLDLLQLEPSAKSVQRNRTRPDVLAYLRTCVK